MGGTIWVESQEGVGSVFLFMIRAQAMPSELPAYLHGTVPTLAGKRVLVVDENPTLRGLLVTYLAWWDVYVEAIESALAFCYRTHFIQGRQREA